MRTQDSPRPGTCWRTELVAEVYSSVHAAGVKPSSAYLSHMVTPQDSPGLAVGCSCLVSVSEGLAKGKQETGNLRCTDVLTLENANPIPPHSPTHFGTLHFSSLGFVFFIHSQKLVVSGERGARVNLGLNPRRIQKET